MKSYIIAVTLFSLVGIGLCGFVASKAHAANCNTTCTTVGNYQYCNTYCF